MDSTTGSPGIVGSELRDDARTIAGSAAQRLQGEVDARKGGAANQVKAVSSALRRAAEELGQDSPSWLRSAFKSASQTAERLADTVEGKDSRELTQQVQRIARENPGSFLAACAVAGFAAARVMQAGVSGADKDTDRGVSGQTGQPASLPEHGLNFPGNPEPLVVPGQISGGAGL